MRAQDSMLCGFDPRHQIDRGDPVQLIRIDGPVFKVEKRRVRCARCADEPVPADLPPLEEHRATPATCPALPVPERLSALVGILPLDWRQKATGEREPGEEG